MTKLIELKTLPLASLRGQVRNPNRMTKEEFSNLRASIRTLGFLDPPLVFLGPDGYELLDGHHRKDAAIEEGLTEVPCIVTATKEKSVVDMIQLAMNHNRGRVQLDIAEQILRELTMDGYMPDELQATGFSPDEIEDLLSRASKEAAGASGKATSLTDAMNANETGADRPWTIELRFATQAELTEVKRALKKASGKAKDESLGLLHMLRMKEEE